MHYDVNRAKSALNRLVDSPYYSQTWRKIEAATRHKNTGMFAGKDEDLNELVSIGVQNRKALSNLKKILFSKIKTKNDYMRDFMMRKRRREALAILVRQKINGSHMDLQERAAFLRMKHAQWEAEKAAVLKEYGDISWERRNELIAAYWDDLERRMKVMLNEYM